MDPAQLPVAHGGPSVNVTPDYVHQFRAMACDVTIRIVEPTADAGDAVAQAREVFADVESACTRFDPTSALMRANAQPDRWQVVPAELYFAVHEAALAHRATGGRFDPRVLRALEGIGYDRSLPFASGSVTTGRPTAADHVSDHPADGGAAGGAALSVSRRLTLTALPWRPELDRPRRAVRLGTDPIDLGGIGKGLAVRWAAERLVGAGRAVLVEAGGDCHLRGAGPEGDGWRIGVEDPRGGDQPVAVLALTDLACATSSIRLRRWQSDGRPVHHLIDPRTGQPGGPGLLAVTVVGADPAAAEVWSKALFLEGRDGIAALARTSGQSALWVADDGTVETTRGMDPFVIWRADDAG